MGFRDAVPGEELALPRRPNPADSSSFDQKPSSWARAGGVGSLRERRARRPRSLSLAAAASTVRQYVQENGRIWAWLRRESEGQCTAGASPHGISFSSRLFLARPGEGQLSLLLASKLGFLGGRRLRAPKGKSWFHWAPTSGVTPSLPSQTK